MAPSRRTLPIAVFLAFSVGAVATAGFAAFAGEDAPTPAAPRASSSISQAEQIAADLAELRADTRAATHAIEQVSDDVDSIMEERRATAEATPAPDRPQIKKPYPRKPRPKPETPTTSTHRPIEIDDDRNPLAGVR